MTAVEVTFDRDSDNGAVEESSYDDVLSFITAGFTQRAGGVVEVLTNGYRQIGSLISSNPQQSVRYYVRRQVDGSSNVVFGNVVDGADGETVAQIRVRASDAVQARDKFTARYTTPGGVMPLDAWARIERRYDTSAQTMDTRIFVGTNLEGTTPDYESLGDTMNLEPVDGGLSLRIGPVGTSTPTATLQFRDFAYDHDGAWIGPRVRGPGTMRIGGQEVQRVFAGAQEVSKVYLGSTQVFSL